MALGGGLVAPVSSQGVGIGGSKGGGKGGGRESHMGDNRGETGVGVGVEGGLCCWWLACFSQSILRDHAPEWPPGCWLVV